MFHHLYGLVGWKDLKTTDGKDCVINHREKRNLTARFKSLLDELLKTGL